jgi:hypothetical protein
MDEPMPDGLFVELLDPNGVADASGFAIDVEVRPPDQAGGREVRVTVRRTGEGAVERGVRIGLELPVDDEPPGWLIPGLFYGENRPPACRRVFPRYERGTRDDARMTSEAWAFRADRAATPAAFGWSSGRMAMVAVDETSPIGPAGIGFVGSKARTAVWADVPYREEPIAYRGDERAEPADVRTHRWEPDQIATITVRIAIGYADRHGYASPLRALHARSAGRPRPWVSARDAAALAADGLLQWHYHPEHRALYETATFERRPDGGPVEPGDRPHMHVGWVSGVPWAAQLLAWGRRIGSAPHVAAGLDVLGHIAGHLSPSGTFWASWTRDGGWGTGWSPRGTIHANTIGQATLFFLRALATEFTRGFSHPDWEAAVRANLDAVAARQRDDGNLGTYHDAQTGAVTEWDGAGALIWIAAFLAAADRFGDAGYRGVADRAGGYYRRFVDDELIYGAPEDVHLAPTSEDGYNAVIAFTALHRSTGDPAWLDVARRAADWTLTWRYAYDVAFDPSTILGAHRFSTTGTDQASVVNQHLHHFGLLCGPELVELARLTGDDHYRQRAAETLAAWRQFIARHDGDFGARRGMVTERFYQTECFEAKGSVLPLSHAWTGGVLLFACLAALDEPDAYAGFD